MTQLLTFIHLGENPRLVSGYSRKAYQVKVRGNTVTRTWGPVDSVGRKTVWAQTPTRITDSFPTAQETRRALEAIVRLRLAHKYRVAKPGETPIERRIH